MRVLVQNTLTNRQWVGYEGPAGLLIGRDAECGLCLESRFVSSRHARLERGEKGWEIELLAGVNPIEVNGQSLAAGQRKTLGHQAVIRLMEFVLTLEDETSLLTATDDHGEELLNDFQNELHTTVLKKLDLRLGGWKAEFGADRAAQLDHIVDDLLLGEFQRKVFDSPITPQIVLRALRARAGEWITRKMTTTPQSIASEWRELGANQEMERSLDLLASKLISAVGFPPGKALPPQAEEQLDSRFAQVVGPIQEGLLENLRHYLVISYLKKHLYDMTFGLGPLEDLLRNPGISEIMVVSPTQIYVERNGRVVKIPQTFPSKEASLSIIERIVAPLGRRIDRSQPLVDARLRDGSRVNAIIEPLAIKGPCITIRKFPIYRVSVEDMIRWESLTASAVALLRGCILHRCNLLVAGGTGSGKTTLLNVLSSMIPAQDRLVTIEDSAELRLQQEHVVSLETKPANTEGKGQYTTRDLVKNALRMRPDRIIVGECRGDEAVDMLQAMNTGHHGSMTTIHANTASDAIARLETMVLMGSDIPLAAVRRQIASAIHLIVFVQRQNNGQRLVTQITEVTDLHPQSGEVQSRDIMRAVEYQGRWQLRPTGYMPRFLSEMVAEGHLKLESWFAQVQATGGLAG